MKPYQKPSIITPYKKGTGGIACHPMLSNIPEGKEGWVLTRCPSCGRECWETPEARDLMSRDSTVHAACTMCALAHRYKKEVGC